MNSILKRAIILAIASTSITFSGTAAKAADFINILTGGTSGVYYPLGVALSKIYGEKIPSAKTQVQATKASVENLNLLQQGRGEIAFSLGDSLKAAWDGDTLLGVGAMKPLDAQHGEVKSMHTAQAARRRGVGSAILQHIIMTSRDPIQTQRFC